MARRNRVSQGPVFVIMLLILAVWLYLQGGEHASLFSPAGMLILLALLLVFNAFLRKKARPQPPKRPVTHNPYGHIPRRPERDRHTRSNQAFSRTARAAKPQTWPYDGSYCVHCGLKKRHEDLFCRRCHQPIDYSG